MVSEISQTKKKKKEVRQRKTFECMSSLICFMNIKNKMNEYNKTETELKRTN